jgi:hypothetical protein
VQLDRAVDERDLARAPERFTQPPSIILHFSLSIHTEPPSGLDDGTRYRMH